MGNTLGNADRQYAHVRRATSTLVPYARNARTHSDEQVRQLAASLREFGFTNPVLIDEAGTIVAGHGRVMAAHLVGLSEVPCIVLAGLTEAQRRAYVLADNQLAINSGWNEDLLREEMTALKSLDFDLDLIGFDQAALDALLRDDDAAPTSKKKKTRDETDVPALPLEPVTRRGDVWVLGPHRLMCGDSTLQADVDTLLGGVEVDLICTDPPYCSGGFQEVGKSAGSVGTSATHKMIANDTLSTRGYLALLKSAFSLLHAPYLYAFTDWRMWLNLFDVAESSGFGVRSMIVWDKGTPGMGRGWRAQHELVLWACKKTPPFDKHASGVGNVLQAKRTGNVHHTTEKPVEIMEALLDNTPFARTVADPFTGSGTTAIGCEKLGRVFRGMELDPLYVDVAVQRWQRFADLDALRESDGLTFAEASHERTRIAA